MMRLWLVLTGQEKPEILHDDVINLDVGERGELRIDRYGGDTLIRRTIIAPGRWSSASLEPSVSKEDAA